MLEKLLEFIKDGMDNGFKMPFIKDPVTKLPSVTMFFAYVSFTILIASLIYLHMKVDAFIASCTTAGVWTLATVFYLMRSLSKAKIDLDDKEISLENDDNKQEKENT